MTHQFGKGAAMVPSKSDTNEEISVMVQAQSVRSSRHVSLFVRLICGFALCGVLQLTPALSFAVDPIPAPAAKATARKAPADAPAKAPADASKAPAQARPVVQASKAAKPAARAVDKTAPNEIRDAASKAFQAVDLNALKNKPGWDQPYLLAAYGAAWLVMMLYMMSLARRLRQTEIELQRVDKRLSNASDDD